MLRLHIINAFYPVVNPIYRFFLKPKHYILIIEKALSSERNDTQRLQKQHYKQYRGDIFDHGHI